MNGKRRRFVQHGFRKMEAYTVVGWLIRGYMFGTAAAMQQV